MRVVKNEGRPQPVAKAGYSPITLDPDAVEDLEEELTDDMPIQDWPTFDHRWGETTA